MSQHPKRIAIFGATGTIGDNALDIIAKHPTLFRASTLTANRNAKKLIALAHQFAPEQVVIGDDSLYKEVRDALPPSIHVLSGESGLIEAASLPCERFLSAIIGFSGLRPTMAAIEAGHTIALANKECLVAAGSLVMDACKRHKATLLPVDSEHNGLFQLWHTLQDATPTSVTLTASGGPFRGLTLEHMHNVTPAQAIAHPNWDMGAKISVDSASLMNKGLELIEAMHLFDVSPDTLHALIHPQSIIHCLIGLADGSCLTQCALPDMRTPLAHALHYPKRLALDIPALSLADIGTLTFEHADATHFPCLALAHEAMHAGQWAQITLNAANEIAVEAFLQEKIRFTDIAALIADTLAKSDSQNVSTLDDVYTIDHITREIACEYLRKY